MEKDRKIKTVAIASVLVAIIGLSIAFAALSQTLTINGTAKADKSTWQVVWEKISGENFVTTGTAEVQTGFPKLDNDTSKMTGVDLSLGTITLKKPGDKVTYRVNMANNGDIDAKVTGVTGVSLDNTYVSYSVKYLDDNTDITQANGRLLAAGAKKLVLIEVKFKEDVTTEAYNAIPSEGITVDFNQVSISYTQDDGTGESDPEPTPITNPWITHGLTSNNVVYSTSSTNMSYVCSSGYMSDSNNIIMTLGDDGSLYTGWDRRSYTPEATDEMLSQVYFEDNLFMITANGILFEFNENGVLNVYNNSSSNTVSALKALLNDPSNIRSVCNATVQN